jgi:hypothetical protein
MASTHLSLGFPSGLLPSGFLTNNLYVFLFLKDEEFLHWYL